MIMTSQQSPDQFRRAGRPPLITGRYLLVWGMVTILLFGVIWWAIASGRIAGLDRAISLALRQGGAGQMVVGPPWVGEMMLDLTAMGGTTMIVTTIVVVTTVLRLQGQRSMAWILLGATISGSLLVSQLKQFFMRPRPTMVDHLVAEHSFSFPSGHATNSAILYVTLALLFWQSSARRSTRRFILAAALLLALMIGISRVALGVHYPSDILAGWLLGTFWAGLWASQAKLATPRPDRDMARNR